MTAGGRRQIASWPEQCRWSAGGGGFVGGFAAADDAGGDQRLMNRKYW